MSRFPYRFRDLKLQEILEKEVKLPEGISEADFVKEIQNNDKIKWRVNSRWFTKLTLSSLADPKVAKKWKFIKQLHWVIVVSIIVFAFWKQDSRILLFFLVYPFLTIGFPHLIFILILAILLGLTGFFRIHIAYLWFFVATVIAGYVINKVTEEMLEKNILHKALSDWPTFWRYYSGQIIEIEPFLDNEYLRLIKKFPDLIIEKNG